MFKIVKKYIHTGTYSENYFDYIILKFKITPTLKKKLWNFFLFKRKTPQTYKTNNNILLHWVNIFYSLLQSKQSSQGSSSFKYLLKFSINKYKYQD